MVFHGRNVEGSENWVKAPVSWRDYPAHYYSGIEHARRPRQDAPGRPSMTMDDMSTQAVLHAKSRGMSTHPFESHRLLLVVSHSVHSPNRLPDE